MSENIGRLRETLQSLLSRIPPLTTERIPGGSEALANLAPTVRARLESIVGGSPDLMHRQSDVLETDLLMMVSLECAAGACGDRCRMWFRCMTDLAAGPTCREPPNDPVDAAVYSSLARDFTRETIGWPQDIQTERTADRVVYSLFTGRQLQIDDRPDLFDNRYWLALYQAAKVRNAPAVVSAFAGIAEWWLSEYRDAGQSRFDLAEYPCFEPLPNAALSLIRYKDLMPVRFTDPEHEVFYMAALI
jgi:hypothetical protein